MSRPSKSSLLRNPLFFAGLAVFLAVSSAAAVYVCQRYSAYVMLFFLSLVAAVAGFALFDTDVSKLIAGFTLYVPLVAPFFLAYSQLTSRVNLALMQGYAMVFITATMFAAILADDLLLGSTLVKLFQLAKRFMMVRRFRFFLSLLSVALFAAGVTSLALILPLYALVVPFGIVVCELAIPIFGNVLQRRREMLALAAVGLNPDYLSGISMAEAVILGFLGGGVGYALGLTLSLSASLPLTALGLSTGWMVTVILLSLAAALTAAILPSAKASMLATPSLLRRWWREAPPFVGWPPTWTVEIPVRLREGDVDSFISFFHEYARALEGSRYGSMERAEEVRVFGPETAGEGEARGLRFRYIFNEGSTPMIVAENELRVSKSPRSEEHTVHFTVRVMKHESVPDIYQALEHIVSTYRLMAFEWTRVRRRAHTPSDM